MPALTRGGNKDIRPLLKEIKAQGFDLQHCGTELLIIDSQGQQRGQIRLSIHDHRALRNLKAELRRNGVLPRPSKTRSRRNDHSRCVERPRAEAVTMPAPVHDQYDWLRRPLDRDRSAILRQRLRVALEPLGGTTAANRRKFAAAALRLAANRGRRTFSAEEPQYAAEQALRYLLDREGSLSIWALKLFGETVEELERRTARVLAAA